MKRLLRYVLCLNIVIISNSFSQLSNDEVAGAMVVTALPFSVTQNTTLATPNNADPKILCNDTAGLGKTVWFKYVADTTRNVFFSSIGSTPATDYDIMMGFFTGTPGNLTEVKCNDDAGGTRQSEIYYTVQAGTTYYILVGEWNGGGTSGGVPTGGNLLFRVFAGPEPIMVKGPKLGSVASGVTITTNTFSALLKETSTQPIEREAAENPETKLWLAPKGGIQPTGPEGSNYIEDKVFERRTVASAPRRPVQTIGFVGFPATSYIPPDPMLAVGPNHVIVMVNSSYRIFDKNGTLLKSMTAAQWFGTLIPGLGISDPHVIYDHYAKRFVMATLAYPATGTANFHVLAVSADSNALGTWYQWKTDATMYGDSTSNDLGDYPMLGYDSSAVYLTSRQFYTSSSQHIKLRIFKKSELYSNTAGKISYVDFWDFIDGNVGQSVDQLYPTKSFTPSPIGYMMNVPPTNTGNYLTLWKINNPASTSPSITFNHIPTVAYSSPKSPDQFGGGTPRIENGGSAIRSDIIYRDGLLYTVHQVATNAGANSGVHYVSIDPVQNKAVEDIVFGMKSYFHTYPSVMVDNNKNVFVNFSRSNAMEYIGAYATGRHPNDPPGVLVPSIPLREGVANYIVTFGGTRNRWGDYHTAALDPADQNGTWFTTEYVSGKGTWSTWTSKVAMGPIAGVVLTLDKSIVNYGVKNIGIETSSDTASIVISNDGIDSLTISSISALSSNFKLLNPEIFASKIGSLNSITAKIVFTPQSGGMFNDSLILISNDANSPKKVIMISGYGFIIEKPTAGTMYATSGLADGGRIYGINTSNGAAAVIGPIGVTQITSLRAQPTTKELYGIDPSSGAFMKISSKGQNIQVIDTFKFAVNLKGLTFVNDSIIYIGAFSGKIFRVNIKNRDTATIASTGLKVSGLSINPKSGELWMSVRATSGLMDAIYKVDVSTGTTKLVGQTKVGVGTLDIAFDKNGKLYGLTGNTSATLDNKFIIIDTTTGEATSAALTGTKALMAIAFDPGSILGVGSYIAEKIPTKFQLEQNYPNPFNPTTTIRYSVPKQSQVSLTVYDGLGRIVSTLVNDNRQPGNYKVDVNASHLSSGVYYYTIKAGSFYDVKKMLLLK